MAQSGYTPILIYASGTASAVPVNTNLTSSASGAELALNYADGKLFYKDNSGAVQVLATKSSASGSFTNVTVGGTLAVTGAATFSTSLAVTGAATFSTSPTAPTPTVGDSSTKIATTAFVASAITSAVITGTISMWPVSSAPTGYLVCNGSAVSRTTYSALFGVIGTTFGSGDGSTTFNLPNYADRMPIGVGTISSGSGVTGGSSTTTIGLANLPAHDHSITDKQHNHNYQAPSNAQPQSGSTLNCYTSTTTTATTSAYTGITATNTTQSGGTAFANTAMTTISPYLGIYFIIKT